MSAPESVVPQVYADSLPAVRPERQAISRGLFRRILTSTEIVLDFVTCVIGVCLAYFLYFSLNIGRHIEYPMKEVAVVSSVVGLLIVLLFGNDGAYNGGGSLLRIRETERAIRIPAQSLLLLLPFTFLLDLSFSRASFLIALILMPLLLVLEKHIVVSIVRGLHARGHGLERVAIYGAGYSGRRVLSALLQSPNLGLRPVTIVDDDASLTGTCVYELGYKRNRSISVQSGPVTPELLQSCRCSMLVVAIPSLSPDKLAEVSEAAKLARMRISFLPGLTVPEHDCMESIDIDGLLLTTLTDPVDPWYYSIAKRSADIIISSLLLLALAPLLLVIMLLVRLDSPGSSVFVQKRVGKNGCHFNMYKFRSMHTRAPEYGFSPTGSDDPRITGMGRFLRKTSLDELPQLVNVLMGDMSLVGPRPEMPFIVESYNLRHRQRLQVTPGVTGLWQLSADRAFQIHENIQYDLYYIRNRSFFMDMAILLHTVFFAMRGV